MNIFCENPIEYHGVLVFPCRWAIANIPTANNFPTIAQGRLEPDNVPTFDEHTSSWGMVWTVAVVLFPAVAKVEFLSSFTLAQRRNHAKKRQYGRFDSFMKNQSRKKMGATTEDGLVRAIFDEGYPWENFNRCEHASDM